MKRSNRVDVFLSGRSATAIILTLFLMFTHTLAAYPQAVTGADLRIVRVDENIAPHARGSLLVQVQEVTAGPVAGAEVTFSVQTGAGDFAGGRQQITVLTNAQGIASAEGFHPSKANVAAEILVNVRYKDLSVSRTLSYNVPREGAKHWKWYVLAGAAGAAVLAAVLASRGNSAGATSGGAVVVQVGTPTLTHP